MTRRGHMWLVAWYLLIAFSGVEWLWNPSPGAAAWRWWMNVLWVVGGFAATMVELRRWQRAPRADKREHVH